MTAPRLEVLILEGNMEPRRRPLPRPGGPDLPGVVGYARRSPSGALPLRDRSSFR